MGWESGVRVGICVGNSRMGTWEGTSHLSRHPHDGCSVCAYLMLHLKVKSFLYLAMRLLASSPRVLVLL